MTHPTILTFTIPDMTCEGCIASISRAVRRLDGMAEITADLAAKHLIIGSIATASALTAVIEDAGFTVQR